MIKQYICPSINKEIMIQTTIIPENTTVSIIFPNSYIGKKVHALVFTDEEIDQTNQLPSNKKPSDYFQTLSPEEGEKMHQHLTESRK